jgi:hypothetical protein
MSTSVKNAIAKHDGRHINVSLEATMVEKA